MESLGLAPESEAVVRTLTQHVLKTSEIEGEAIDGEQVRSSLAQRLGLELAGMVVVQRPVDGLVEMVLDATQNFSQPLTEARLWRWHAGLVPNGGHGRAELTVGGWRTDALGPMQGVSGDCGREHVHVRAPPANRIADEMAAFLSWFEESDRSVDPVLKAAVAHIWFVTIHPFDGGNGRIARAIADLALARSEGTGKRFYSMSSRLRVEQNAYHQTLEVTQRGDLDLTMRLSWFLDVLDKALSDAETTCASVLRKARMWQSLTILPLNARQRHMLNRLLDGFQGKLTSSKWAKIAKCSQDTALRDIDDLVAHGVLARNPAGGRSTSYSITEPRA